MNDILIDIFDVVTKNVVLGQHLFVSMLGVLWGELATLTWVIQHSIDVLEVDIRDEGLLKLLEPSELHELIVGEDALSVVGC